MILPQLDAEALPVCTCWEILRRDNVVIRLTDHDREVTCEGKSYYPMAPYGAALERPNGLKETSSELKTVLSNDLITHDDIQSGMFDNAAVWVYHVNWETSTRVTARRAWFSKLEWDDGAASADLLGLSSYLKRDAGWTLDRTCRFRLYGARCGLDREDFQAFITVSSIITPRRSFNVTGTPLAGHSYDGGEYVWESGLNHEMRGDVKSMASGELHLFLPTPRDVVPGDTLLVYPGCNGTHESCILPFDNVKRFGGQPFIPGTDRALSTPAGA